MTKFQFIHAADVHLDSPLRGLAAYETAPAEEIRGASRRAFENLVELALTRGVAFVLLAGDLYDGDWQDMRTGLWMMKQLARLTDAQIPVVMVSGNHDAQSKMTKKLRAPKGVTRLGARKAESVELPGVGDGVVVHGQSYGRAEVTQNLVEGYPEAKAGGEGEGEGWFNIGLLHTALEGRANHASYAPCSVSDLEARGYDYWALGHVHEWEILSRDPWIVFPGCVQGRHIRETGPKGCAVVTVEEGRVVEVEREPLDVLRWAEVTVDLGKADADADAGEDADADAGEGVRNLDEALDRVQAALEAAALAAEDRPLAARVTVVGATGVDQELRAEPDQWVDQVRNIAGQLTQYEIWVEKVRIKTEGLRRLKEELESGSDLGDLLQTILDVGLTPVTLGDELPELIKDSEQLKKSLTSAKLPVEWFSGESGAGGLDPTDPVALTGLAEEARELLVARLLAAASLDERSGGDGGGAGGGGAGRS